MVVRHLPGLAGLSVAVRACLWLPVPDRRLGGASPACPTPLNREIDFDFDFDSFVRAGEAKLCVCVRHASSTLGLRTCKSARLRAVWGAIVDSKKHGV